MKRDDKLKNKRTGEGTYVILNFVGEKAVLQPPWADDRWPEPFMIPIEDLNADYEVIPR